MADVSRLIKGWPSDLSLNFAPPFPPSIRYNHKPSNESSGGAISRLIAVFFHEADDLSS
jgi:hypothetical protein